MSTYENTDSFRSGSDKKGLWIFGGNNPRNRNILIAAIVLIILGLVIYAFWPRSKQFVPVRVATYQVEVQRHTNLAKIAIANGATPFDAQLLNQRSLGANWGTLCRGVSVDQWPQVVHAGFYCNPTLALPEASTLQPRTQLIMPATTFGIPDRALALAKGLTPGGIVLLINDDAGQSAYTAAAAVHMAMRERGLGLDAINVWVYSPTHHYLTRYLERGTAMDLDHGVSTVKAAFAQLNSLATTSKFVLITDERDFHKAEQIGSMKPVYTLGLTADSVDALSKLANATHGHAY